MLYFTSAVPERDQTTPDSPSLRRRHSDRDLSSDEHVDESSHPRKKRRSSAFVTTDDTEAHDSPSQAGHNDDGDINMFDPQRTPSPTIPSAQEPVREPTPRLSDDMKHKVVRTIASVDSTEKFPERFFFDIELSEEEADSVRRWSLRAEEME